MDNTYTGVQCNRCHEPMARADFIADGGECDKCKDAHLDSITTDHLGMGEWHDAKVPKA